MERETCNILREFKERLHFLFQVSCYMFHENEVAKIYSQIYSQRKSSDSPGGFGLERTGKINFGIISKNF